MAGLFGGEGAAFFACGDAAGVLSIFFAVDPLEEGVEQEITAENAKREEHGKRHRNLTRAHVNGESGHGKSRGGKAKKS